MLLVLIQVMLLSSLIMGEGVQCSSSLGMGCYVVGGGLWLIRLWTNAHVMIKK